MAFDWRRQEIIALNSALNETTGRREDGEFYKSLLEKYMRHIVHHEGCVYIEAYIYDPSDPHDEQHPSAVHFSDSERACLSKLSCGMEDDRKRQLGLGA